MKQLFQEGDYIAILEGNDRPQVFMVQRTEDVVADYQFADPITTLTIGQSEQIELVEPKQLTEPLIEMYQLRVGVDVGVIYTEMLSGTYRRTPFKQKKPTTGSPWVGYFSGRSSPRIDPQYEFFLRFNERPAFSVFNPKGFSIQPCLHFTGRKLLLVVLNPSSEAHGGKAPDNIKASQYLHIKPERAQQIADAVIANTITHRRITAYGIDE